MTRAVPHGRTLVLALTLLLVAACASPAPLPPDVSLSRETPEATFAYFKTMAQSNQWAGEWAVFSPNFKRMLNQQAGRNVDLGDYSTARQTIATNSNAEMQMLLGAELQGVQYVGADRARVSITAGGRSISPTFVRMTKWELKIRGQSDSANGVVTHPGDAVRVNDDGSITVRVQADPGVAAALRTVPREQIEGFAIKSEWFVDDFGGLLGAVSQAPASSGSQAQPGSYAPPATTSGGAASAGPSGYGSPDG